MEKTIGVNYSEIAKKNLLLVGIDKYMDDVIDYFEELSCSKRSSLQKLPDDAAKHSLYVICDFDEQRWLDQISEIGLEYKTGYIWIRCLINILSESETYFTSAYHPSKPVVVLGDKISTELILKSNPSLNAYAVLEISDWSRNVAEILNAQIPKFPANPIFLLATREFIAAKKAMIGIGFKFGDDFYFFDENNSKLAEMLERTIRCETFEPFSCSIARLPVVLGGSGEVSNCCGATEQNLGSILCNSLENVFVSPMARILHLSTLNRTYCFCNDFCKYRHRSLKSVGFALKRNNSPLPRISNYNVSPGYIQACNIYCRSCRNEKILDDKEPFKLHIHEEFMPAVSKLKEMGHPTGELLFSKLARELLEADSKDNLKFNTNGTLMNQKNWDYLMSLYSDISCTFSIDGATKETFEYLRRGAKYETVFKNLELAGELRKSGMIRELLIRYVVQQDNFREMELMVETARKVHADKIFFARMQNLGSFTHEQYVQLDVHNPQSTYHNEFVIMAVTNPIFHDSDFVRFEGLIHLLESARNLYQNLESKNDELTRLNDNLREQHSKLTQQCVLQKATINEIYGSNTWKVGYMLRSIYRRIIPFRK